MNAPGMHCSGPRPKLHRGDPSLTSSAIFWGVPQERCAVPAGELPLGAQCTARYWLFTVGVFPFWKLTTTSPVGRTATSECPLKLQLLGCRPGDPVVGGHRRIDGGLAVSEQRGRAGEVEVRPRLVDHVAVRAARIGVRRDLRAVGEGGRAVVLRHDVLPAGGSLDQTEGRVDLVEVR